MEYYFAHLKKQIMKAFLLLLLPYLHKMTIVWKALFSKKGIILTIPLVMALPILTTRQQIGCVLGFLMFIDFVTGVMVSHKAKTELEKTKPELKNERLISSSGLKKTGVKFLLYGSTILTAYWIQNILKINKFSFSFTDLSVGITLLVMLFWVTVEIYSIVFENFKALGFDVFAKFNNIIEIFKKGKAKFNETKD